MVMKEMIVLNERIKKKGAVDSGTASSLIRLEQVGKSYGSRKVLSEISLSLDRGESLILRGGNGSGKSTLLKIVAGIIPASSGRIHRSSKQLQTGYAPDRLPKLRMTSEEYLIHMGRIAGMPTAALTTRIEELHELLELPAYSPSLLIHYSKGMLQKVNLMQACLLRPALLLLDEPFSGLDTASSEKLLTLLHGLRAEGTAVITALHDPLPSWESVSTTYRIREGQLILEETHTDEASNSGSVRYELDGLLTEKARERLAVAFPRVDWTAAGNAVRCEIPSEDCHAFMRDFWQAEGIVLSLNRKEGEV